MAHKTDRERQQARRDRARRDGLVKLECWVTPKDREKIRGWLAGEHALRQKRKPKNRTRDGEKTDNNMYYFKIELSRLMSHNDINKLERMGFHTDGVKGCMYINKRDLSDQDIEDARNIAMMADTSMEVVTF